MVRTAFALVLACNLCLAFCVSLVAQDPDAKVTLLRSSVIAASSEHLAKSDIEGFYRNLPGNDFLKGEALDRFLDESKQKLQMVAQKYGPLLDDADLVREEVSGDCYRQFSLAQKFEKGMVFWRVVYYRTDDEWKLRHIHFDMPEKGLQVESSNAASADSRPREIADAFMAQCAADKIDDAMNYFKQNAVEGLAETMGEQGLKRISLKIQLESVEGNTATDNFQLVKTEMVGKDFVRYYYLNRRAKSAHHVQLTLYKGRENWKFYGWSWSNDAPIVFEAYDPTKISLR